MADDRTFLLPVVIDAAIDASARVPERFRDVQWTLLPGGATPGAFAERVRRLRARAPRWHRSERCEPIILRRKETGTRRSPLTDECAVSYLIDVYSAAWATGEPPEVISSAP